MSKIKDAAELYALGQIFFQQLEETCGGRVTESVINYVRAYEHEFNLHQQIKKLQDQYEEATQRTYELELELESNISKHSLVFECDDNGNVQSATTLKVGAKYIIPAQLFTERINK